MILSLLWLLITPVQAQYIQPFKTDLCTHYPNATDGILRPYTKCCLIHDVEYYLGGTKSDRKNADKNLKKCFKDMGYNLRSSVVFTGVRLFGKHYWGYAFKDLKPAYWDLTPEQKKILLIELNFYGIDKDTLSFMVTERDL